RLRVRAARSGGPGRRSIGGRGALRRFAREARKPAAGPCGRICGVDRTAGGTRRQDREGAMSVLGLAVPAKGRLQEYAEAFFARAGLELVKPRGARDYRGGIKRLDGVEVAFLSAAEITEQLAAGAVHLGITGEDLVREMIPDADHKVVLL